MSRRMADESEENTPEKVIGRRWGRLLAYALAYALAALPGAVAAIQGQYAASRDTVAKVNLDKSRDVAQLQEWVKSTRTDLDALSKACEARTDRLREEVQRGQAELTRAILQLASTRRVLPETREQLQTPIRPVLPSAPKTTLRRLPALEPPASTLEQVEAKTQTAE
jgi:hypothetical protein